MPIKSLPKGDIVFTANGSDTGMHKLIAKAQTVGVSPGHAESVHVAIATGNGLEVFESVGGGIMKREIVPGQTYRLYSYRGRKWREIRDLTVAIAEEHYARQNINPGFGRYHKVRAALSPFRPRTLGETTTSPRNQQFGDGAAASTRFFCSNFVFRCVTGAGEACNLGSLPIRNSHPQVSPRDLEGLMMKMEDVWHSRRDGDKVSRI